jgi:hypothetical protein
MRKNCAWQRVTNRHWKLSFTCNYHCVLQRLGAHFRSIFMTFCSSDFCWTGHISPLRRDCTLYLKKNILHFCTPVPVEDDAKQSPYGNFHYMYLITVLWNMYFFSLFNMKWCTYKLSSKLRNIIIGT